MPTYHYKCDKCGDELEKVQKFADKPLKRCPSCKKNGLYKIIYAPDFFVRGSDRETVGTAAEKNAKRVGSYKISEEQEKKKIKKGKKKENPWWRPNSNKPDLSLNKLSPEKLEKYIMTGEK